MNSSYFTTSLFVSLSIVAVVVCLCSTAPTVDADMYVNKYSYMRAGNPCRRVCLKRNCSHGYFDINRHECACTECFGAQNNGNLRPRGHWQSIKLVFVFTCLRFVMSFLFLS